MQKEPEISPVGIDRIATSSARGTERRASSDKTDASVLSPEIALALVETERDFLLGSAGCHYG